MYEKDGQEYILPFEKGFLERQKSNKLTKRGDDGRLYVAAFAVGFVILSKFSENPNWMAQAARKTKSAASTGWSGIRRAGEYIGESSARRFDQVMDKMAEYDSPLDMAEKSWNKITEKATEKWLQAKAVKFRKVKIVIRSNNESEIGVFANRVYSKFKGYGLEFRKYSPVDFPFFLANSVPQEISMQEYNSFPNDKNKLEAMFTDKNIYLQTALRPKDGPFYQVQGEFDLHYLDIPDLAKVIYSIFRSASTYNEEFWVKYNKKNTGVQISLEVVDE